VVRGDRGTFTRLREQLRELEGDDAERRGIGGVDVEQRCAREHDDG
jgi:hypothetical protein